MRVKTDFYGGVRVWLSGCDTADWANCHETRWRNSELSGREVYAELSAHGDLLEVRIDGSLHTLFSECELRAMLDDCLCGEGVGI
jgi:hypothetical protein